MPAVEMLHMGLGGREFEGVRPASLLPNPDDSAALCQRFRRLLTATPAHFLEQVEIRRHPLIRLQWVALCRTAGLVLLRSGTPDPDVYCLLPAAQRTRRRRRHRDDQASYADVSRSLAGDLRIIAALGRYWVHDSESDDGQRGGDDARRIRQRLLHAVRGERVREIFSARLAC